MRRVLKTAMAATACLSALTFSTSALAATQVTSGSTGGIYTGTDCSGAGGFPNCYATQGGVVQGPTNDPLASSAIYKINSDGSTDLNSIFSTVTGAEFGVTLVGNTLSFTYTAGAGDPAIHYYSVKQGDVYVLFYDPNPITSGSVNLSTYFPNNPGFSHITFFDSTNRGVPEPATWAMMLLGFGGIGVAMRRRRKPALAQVA